MRDGLRRTRSVRTITQGGLASYGLCTPFSKIVTRGDLRIKRGIMPNMRILGLMSSSQLGMQVSIPRARVTHIMEKRGTIVRTPILGKAGMRNIIARGNMRTGPLSQSCRMGINVRAGGAKLLPNVIARI